MPNVVTRRIRSFARVERGSLTVEACFVIPLIAFLIIITFQLFDAYRTHTVNLRAAYTIGDMISRETDPVGPKYLQKMQGVFNYVTRAKRPTGLRVTSIYYDTSGKKYKVNWSYTSGVITSTQTDATINNYAAKIPALRAGETLIVVETQMDYAPIFNMGLNDLRYEYLVTTAPRFASQVPYSASS